MNVVGEFAAATGGFIPANAQVIPDSKVKWLVEMQISETYELLATIMSPLESFKFMSEALLRQFKEVKPPSDDYEKCAAQADAIIDSTYYGLDTLAKSGINAQEVFDEVHSANMRKIIRGNVVFKDSQGKVLKPLMGFMCNDGSHVQPNEEWYEGDVVPIITRQMEQGNNLQYDFPEPDVVLRQ